MATGFTKLVPEIVQSSIWNESSDVRVVWITMLAVKDENGYVRGDAKTIARLANVTLEAADEALRKFQEPDPSSRTPDRDGRRIEPAPGGWVILNHDLYRTGDRNEYMREYMRNYREKKALGEVSNTVSPVNVNESLPSASASVNSASASCSSGVRGVGEGAEPILANSFKPLGSVGKASERPPLPAESLMVPINHPLAKGRYEAVRLSALKLARSWLDQHASPRRFAVFDLGAEFAEKLVSRGAEHVPRIEAEIVREDRDRSQPLFRLWKALGIDDDRGSPDDTDTAGAGKGMDRRRTGGVDGQKPKRAPEGGRAEALTL